MQKITNYILRCVGAIPTAEIIEMSKPIIKMQEKSRLNVKKFIKALKIPTAIVAVLLLVMAITVYTLQSNSTAGIYPTDADSISIPLFETAVALIIILVLFAIAFVLTNFVFAKWRIAVVIGVFLYLGCALLATLMAWSWFTPHHYSIVTSYAIVILTALTLAVSAFRKRP